MAKKKYRTFVGMNFPATPAALKKAKAGQELSYDETIRVEAGKITDAIPAESVKWLLRDGLIEGIK